MRPMTATGRLSMRPMIVPRQQPSGPPFTSPCASGGSDCCSSTVCWSGEGVVASSGCSVCSVWFSSGIGSKCSKLAVACITQARHDETKIVEAIIKGRDVNVNVGVGLRELEQAVGSRDNAHIGETWDTTPFEDIDRVDGRSSGREHGVYRVAHLQVDAQWELVVILHGL